MMSYDFQTHTHGKWILAGEHSVLRNNPALVFPVLEKTLTLTYHRSKEALHVSCIGTEDHEMREVLWRTLEEGMRHLNGSLNEMTGQMVIQNTIPVGSGMGASAALCVAAARWFTFIGLLKEQEQLMFAKRLENIFHGKSSGVDIAGASSSSGVYFQDGVQQALITTWKPQWYLSFCGEVGLTSHCIEKVQSLWQDNTQKALHIDQQMNESVALACTALQTQGGNAQRMLAEAINLASSCFLQWGLVSDCLHAHMQYLRDQGAVAVKPTGSGGGGFVVSLWEKPLPQMAIQLMAI